MKKQFRNIGATAIILAMTAPVAHADLTADDVWADWQKYMAAAGYDLTAAAQRSGNQLNISDLTMVVQIPDEDATMSLNLSAVTMVENGDGSVNIQFPSPMPIRFSVEGGAEGGSGTVIINHTGSVMQVVGDSSEMTYTHSSQMNEITLGDIIVDGEPMPAEIMDFRITMNNTGGVTRWTTGDLREFDQTYSVGSLSYSLAFQDPQSDDAGSAQGSMTGLSFTGAGAMPTDVDSSDMVAMMAGGLKVDGGFTYDSGNSDLKGTGDGSSFAMTTSTSGGNFGFAINDTNLRYEIASRDLDVNVSGNEIPFPVSAQMGQSAFTLDAPVAQSDAPQDFQLGMTFGDFTMSDLLWGIVDPGAILPRDPATIAIDLSGKARMLFNLMDPEAMMTVEQSATPPAEIESLNINQLLVSLVGATLSGNGAFTFDNSDLQTFGGVPRPTGSVNLSLVGGNGLIDKLIQMGIVSDQDAMGARMMMGMLAVPGDAPDTLNSTIEINAQGHVLANGQRIQ